MENCMHVIEVKVINGMAVSYCIHCGKILDTKPVKEENHKDDTYYA